MYLLRILGGASLEGPDGRIEGRAGQRRQLALMAALALARGRAVARDRLIGLFWPDSDTDRARRQLSDAVYLIRRDLGEDCIRTAGDELQLDPERVATDVGAFEAALAEGAFASAVRLYGGPLLDGAYLSDAPEWERHVDAERRQLAFRFADALEAVADEATRHGDVRGAVAAWRQRAALDPLDARVCARLMEALAAAGDRAGALQQAQVHETLLREELDAAPDAGVRALAERLRAESPGHEPPVPRPPAEAGGGGGSAGGEDPPATAAGGATAAAVVGAGGGAGPSASGPPTGEAASGNPAPARLRSRPRRWAAVALALLVVVAAGWIAWRQASGPPAVERLVVLPFAVRGGEQVTYLTEGMVDLLSATLDDAGGLRTVDPRAVLFQARQLGELPLGPSQAQRLAGRFGARWYVQGTVMEAGATLRISATLYDDASEARGSATVEGSATDLFTLVDRLTAELLALHAHAPASRLERLAARTTTSLPALRAYLAAESAFRLRASQWEPEVVDAFQRAVALDSTFALAHYRLSVAAAWVGDAGLSERAGRVAVRHGSRLGRRDRDLLAAWEARLDGDVVRAERLYRGYVERNPDDVEAWWQLAELTMRIAPFRGDSVTAAAPAYRRVLDLDPTHGCARCSLIFIEMQRGDFPAADSLVAGFAAGHTGSVLSVQLVRALASGDGPARRRIVQQLATETAWTVHEAHFRVRMWGRDPAAAAEVGALVDHARFDDEWRGLTRSFLVEEELARGRPAAARAMATRLAELEPGWALVQEALMSVGPVAPATGPERARLLARVEAWRPDTTTASRGYFTASHNAINAELRLYLLGLLRAASGDLAGAERAAEALDSTASGLGRYLASGVRGWIPPDGRALAHLDERTRMLPAEHVWLSPVLGAPHDRFRHAELLAAAGRVDEALRLLGAFGQNPWDTAYLGPVLLLRSRLLERQGRHEEAAQLHRQLAHLWRDAEPAVRRHLAAGPPAAPALGGSR